LNAPEPKSLQQLESFLGLVNYYGKYIPNLSTLAAPLNALRRKDTEYIWSNDCSEAELKAELISPSVLTHFDETKMVALSTDASSYGIGAVLVHVDSDGTDRPIAYASRTLNAHERNYSQIEKEG
jgi:hypothetical protein